MSEFVNEYEGFVIDTDTKAEWAMGKIRDARETRDRMIDWYKEQIRKVTEETDFRTLNLERMLGEYFRMTEAAHKRTKTTESYALPSGKLVMRLQNPEYKRDDGQVISWLKANDYPQYIKVKEELDWAALKTSGAVLNGKLYTEDGEEVPGVEVVEREPKFVVEV